MKRIVFTLLASTAIFLGGNVAAQDKYGPNKEECLKFLSYYQDYNKQKNYESAIPNWRKAFEICPPTASQNMLIHGGTYMTYLIGKNAKNPQRVNELVDTLLLIQDLRMQYYPQSRPTVLNNKGQYIINYRNSDKQYLFNELNAIIDELGSGAKPAILVNDLQASIDLYQAGNLQADDVLATYEKVMACIDGAEAKDDDEAAKNAQTRSDLQGLFANSRIASCENILAIFTPRYEANPNDMALLSTIVKLMNSAEDCVDNDLYINAVTSMYKNDPSSVSPYLLYMLNRKDNIDLAISYLETAISQDEANAAKYTYELANIYLKNGRKAKALEAAKKAAELDAAYTGKAYFLIGTIWGSTSCGDDYISKRAPYWVAVDYLQKAKAADPTLADDANRLIGQFSAYYPEAAEAFMYDLSAGQSYTVSCAGMVATTTVRVSR
ncbi:MAG: hypothetical protein IK143_00100 [Bacteroidales bacterium]|nr:hypothetical protein [Bacteroidales bacterium]